MMVQDFFKTFPIDPLKIDHLARVAVMVGLQIKEGQSLVMTSPVTALPLARMITNYAYKAGASLVTCFFTDEEMTLSRFLHGRDQSFDYAADWLYEGMAKAFDHGAARLAISGGDPMLLSGQDPSKVSRASKANALAYKPALEKITRFDTNWSIVSYPDVHWAKLVFPGYDEKEAFEKLAHAIFLASRVLGEDPIKDWQEHNQNLHKRAKWLNDHCFHALHFKDSHADLVVGLAEGHFWKGGSSKAKNNIVCNANIPTEEVFTAPHAFKTEGFIKSSKPLSYRGSIIDAIEVTFKEGKIIEAKASKGEALLQNVLDTDEGARRLGEVALVPHSSPISAQGVLFYNTLFDENAASHIALGQCYHDCLKDGHLASDKEIIDRGGNNSLIHIDWMIGTSTMNIDGISPDNQKIPVMRSGEWCHTL